jgi:hypothetical protein
MKAIGFSIEYRKPDWAAKCITRSNYSLENNVAMLLRSAKSIFIKENYQNVQFVLGEQALI